MAARSGRVRERGRGLGSRRRRAPELAMLVDPPGRPFPHPPKLRPRPWQSIALTPPTAGNRSLDDVPAGVDAANLRRSRSHGRPPLAKGSGARKKRNRLESVGRLSRTCLYKSPPPTGKSHHGLTRLKRDRALLRLQGIISSVTVASAHHL